MRGGFVHTPLAPTGVAEDAPATLFPKIGKFSNAVDTLLAMQPGILESCESITVTGTVKLHGQHADIVMLRDGGFRLQSRSVDDLIAGGMDVNGFAHAMSGQIFAINGLCERVVIRYLELHQAGVITEEIDPNGPVVLAGEWIGRGVQRGVAVSELEPCFVLYGVQINGEYQDFSHYHDIDDPSIRIFNISEGGVYRQELPINNFDYSLEQLHKVTDTVIANCPFGSAMNVTGAGEGIVWKINTENGNGTPQEADNPRLWFKTKARQQSLATLTETIRELIAQNATPRMVYTRLTTDLLVTQERIVKATSFVKNETSPRTNAHAKTSFADWIVQDCLQEEQSELAHIAGIAQHAGLDGFEDYSTLKMFVWCWAMTEAETLDLLDTAFAGDFTQLSLRGSGSA